MVNPVVQQFNQRFQAIKIFKVKSRTNRNPDTSEFEEYKIELWTDGQLYCNCLFAQFGRKKALCYHANKIKEELERDYGSVEKAISSFRELNK